MGNNVIGLDILAMRKGCEKLQPYLRPDCPTCGDSLETSVDGIRHCKTCGWQDQHPIKRDIEKV